MENIKKLTQYFLSKSKEFNLEVTKLSWPEIYLPGYFDYQAKISLNNQIFIGRGTAENEEKAFIKSCVEALERFVFYSSGSSWAIAGHGKPESAEQNSYAELTGIDKVLCHHFTKTQTKPFLWETMSSDFPAKQLSKMLNLGKILLKTYELTPNQDLKIIIAVAHQPFPKNIKGFIAGFGAHSSIESAAVHAIIECIRNVVVIFKEKISPPDKEFIRSPENPRWHFWKAQGEAALTHFKTYLEPNGTESIRLKPEPISIKDVSFTELDGIKRIFPDIPLVFMQANSDKLLTPQFGEFHPDEKTMKRLETFNGGPVRIDASVPHFYG